MSPVSSTLVDPSRRQWKINESSFARNTFNPIRDILRNLKGRVNPQKKLIDLSLGDPTVFGNLKPHENAIKAYKDSLDSGKYNGYGPSTGHAEARQAVADHVSVEGADVSAGDVILTSGCSTALDHCISVLADRGQNILVPRPAFPLYKTLADGFGILTKEYDCLPEKNWEIDLNSLEASIDNNTAAIIINNPSNPCGAAFSPRHLKEILNVAESYKIPIIADEIYDYFTFSDEYEFLPLASLTTQVPILSCGGLTKRFLVPGWRLGWIVIYDKNNLFETAGIRKALERLTQRQMGPNTLVQGALPTILKDTPSHFHSSTINVVRNTAGFAYEKLDKIPGLKPIMPNGAMYMMVRIDTKQFPDFESDLDFVKRLMEEESLFPLPGKCFNCPDFFRIVLTVPLNMFEIAFERLEEFCLRHRVASLNNIMSNMRFDSAVSMSSYYERDEDEENSSFNGEYSEEEDDRLMFKKAGTPSRVAMVKKNSVAIREA